MRWLRLLLHLYPAVWRERYEEEFVALLEARGLTINDLFDIMLGAWDARRMRRSPRWAGGDMTALNNHKPLLNTTATVSGLVVIALTWIVIFLIALALTEIALVPWDMWDPSRRPPIGSLSRTINDLFENTPAAFLLPFGFIGINVMLLIPALRRHEAKARVLWQFALYNSLFILGLYIVLGVGSGINNWLFPPPNSSSASVGFHRSIAFVLLLIPLVYGWIRLQRGIGRGLLMLPRHPQPI